jgi:tripartite-type tricarboxylate transporter receptor subunit TctC
MERRDFNRRDVFAFGAAALSAPAIASIPAFGQADYPDRPIKMVVPFAPGGVVDAVGRLWAEKVKSQLGTVVIENQGGGGGVIGAQDVARATPDGYTLLLGNTSTQVLNPLSMAKPPYDPVKDFTPITIIDVPYRGAGPGITDLVSGHIPMMTPNVTGQLLELHRAGKIRILAVTSPERLKGAPDIPTAIEAGVPGMIAQLFNGVFGPAGTPKPVVDKIWQATKAALANTEYQSALVKSGFEPTLDYDPAKTAKFLADELKRWPPILQAAGMMQK